MIEKRQRASEAARAEEKLNALKQRAKDHEDELKASRTRRHQQLQAAETWIRLVWIWVGTPRLDCCEAIQSNILFVRHCLQRSVRLDTQASPIRCVRSVMHQP
jgi:hypothetical protein